MGLDVEVRGGVCYLTMNRPDVLNAMDHAMLVAIEEAWDRIENDDSIRVAILTGAGERAFSAGADLKHFAPPGTEVRERYGAFFPTVTKPIIAAVNGLAFGGGTEILGVTDLRVAAEHATFCLSEAHIGLYPAGGSVVRYARQLPWPLAMELMITGRHVTAHEALQWGMVNRVVPMERLMEAAEEYAGMVISCSPVSVRSIKACALETLTLPWPEAFQASIRYQRVVGASEDAAEGRQAWIERRPPQWRNR